MAILMFLSHIFSKLKTIIEQKNAQLFLAYCDIYSDKLCKHCGGYGWVYQSDDNRNEEKIRCKYCAK